jgi:tetratricopeptide (TPR) repeat protein
VLYLQSGRYDQAGERFDEALRLFTTVRNEPRRLATLYNMAHLARERGDTAASLDLYDAAASLARGVGQTVVETGALAGAGLAWLGLGEVAIAARGLEAANTIIGERQDWWFQGRELVEALAVRLALAAGDRAAAERRFRHALSQAERHDLYGAAWLVAECAAPLEAQGVEEVRNAVAQYAPQAQTLGYAPLSARYAAFGKDCGLRTAEKSLELSS